MKFRFLQALAAWWFTLAAGGVLISASAMAQVRLPATVVTANRTVQSLTDVVADVTVLDRTDIERLGGVTLTQLLAQLPGIQTTGYGDTSRVFVRGAEARMTALYIDGVRVESQDGLTLGGGAPWDLVPVAQIERIEVVRGPVSAVYGADAMGGVVQIFTRKDAAKAASQISVAAGSMNTRKASANIGTGQGAWNLALGLGYERTDGFDSRPDLVHTPKDEPQSQQNFTLRGRYQLSATQQLDASVLESQRDSRSVPWSGGTDYIAKGTTSVSSLKWQSVWSPNWRSGLTASLGTVARRDDAPNDYRTQTQSLLWENHVRMSAGTVSAVLEQRRDSFDANATTWDPVIQGERTSNAQAFGYSVTRGAQSFEVQARNDQDSIFGSHSTNAFLWAWNFAQNWRATASSGTAFRAPTLEQTYGPYGSTALQPETNRNTEMGVRYVTETTSVRYVSYRNDFSNMITSSASLSSCSAGFFCYYNVGKASVEGSTLSASGQFGSWQLHGSLDVLQARDDITGKALSLRAQRTTTLGFQTKAGAWQVGADWREVGERFDDAANTTVLPAYQLVNLYANLPIGKNWQAQVRVDNALDQAYQEVGNFATPGRRYLATLQWTAR